jgi:hypothetical protein
MNDELKSAVNAEKEEAIVARVNQDEKWLSTNSICLTALLVVFVRGVIVGKGFL